MLSMFYILSAVPGPQMLGYISSSCTSLVGRAQVQVCILLDFFLECNDLRVLNDHRVVFLERTLRVA